MKKGKLYISIILGLCLCLFTAFGVACGESSTGNSSTGGNSSTEEPATPTLESISVSGETEVFIDEFDYADYTITAMYSDDSTQTATLTAENLSTEDNAKLATVGTHALTVSYESVTCSWTVTLKNHDFAGLTFDDITTTYDGTAKTLTVSGLPTGAQVSYDKATSYTNAGEYTVKATVTLANYNPVELTATLTINKATYDMSAVVFADKTVTYDGQAHSILATNLPNGVTAQYTGNSQINADEYTVTATFTGDSANYEPIANKTATLTINKATYDMSGVRFENTEATYDGQTHFVTATGLPNGVSVDWENNGKVNADTYTVTAKFTGDSTNYNAIPNQTTTLTIHKATITGITFTGAEYTYDGTEKSLAIAGTLPNGVTVSYDKETSYTNAGEYTVTATFSKNANYNDLSDMQATLKINKATYDMTGVVFKDKSVNYTGEAYSIEATNLPEGVSATYNGNNQTQAGEYTITAHFTGDRANYNAIPDMTAKLTISASDLTGISFHDGEFTYDGTKKSIYITGELPDGVEVGYTNNEQINANSYTVTATFTCTNGNYANLPELTATLLIKKATYDMSGVVFKNKSVNYTGEAYSIEATNLPNGVTVDYENNKQTQAGEYTVTAHFTGDSTNYKAIPDMTAKLKINASDLTGISFHDGEFTYDGTAKSIYITGTLPDGVKVEYTNNEQINAESYTVTATFTCSNGNYTNLPELTATLTINKATYDMSAVVFADKTATYDGQAHSILATSLPNGVTAQYTGNNQINADEYTVTATFTGDSQNYELIANKTATLTIEQRELTLAFGGETTLKYNGNVQKTVTVQATNLVNGDNVELTISYDGAMIEAGEYIATATLTAHKNYKLTANNTVKVTITRATHTVTFKQDGFAEVTREVLDLADLTDIPTPQHVDGYKFTWDRTDFTSITEDITVTANKTVITYTIEYVVYDGVNSESNPTTYTVESATFTLKNPTPSETFGKSFGGWFTSPDFTVENKITKIEKGSFGDLKLYAYWLEYRVTEVVGGTVDYSQSTPEITIKVDYGTANLAVKDLISVSDGCTWKLYNGFECLPTQELTAKRLSVSNIGDNIFYILVYHPDSDEYYTDYVLNVYQFDMKAYTFLKDGETWVSGEIQEESAVNAPENPEKTGYTFNGWKVNGEFVSFPYTVLTDAEFVADYTPITYNVSYELNGGENDESNPETYNIEQAYTLKNPTRTGYTFVGWFKEETFDNQVTGIALGSYGDKKFYAKWTPTVYTIAYELNGGVNNAENPETYTIETETITLAEPTKTGYGFKGWYLEETIETRVYTVEKGSYGDKKFYAKWGENTNTLKFDGNGATGGATSNIEMKTAETVALPKCGFVKAGYTFIGWATNADGEVVYIDGANYTMGTNAEYTLYAIWQANLNTLKFDGNGTTGGSMSNMTIATDSTAMLTGNGFEKAGYTFIGWALTADGEVAFADKANYTMGVNAEYTLYAVWQAKNNTLKFNGNGYTSGSMSSMTIATDSTAMLTANNFVRTGYTFIGWATSADGEVVYTDCADYIMGTDSSYTLYAVWLGNLNTIYFDGNGATSGEMSSVQARTGEKITLPLNEYVKTTDYTCTGWATTASGYMYYADGGNYTVGTASEQTLYAYWKQQTASGLVWLIRNNEVSIATYVGTNVGLAIPETIAGYPVTGIDSSAFKDCSSLTSVEIPDSVTSIGSGAFEGCSSLTEITLPFVGASNAATGYQAVFGYIFGYTTQSSSTTISGAIYQYCNSSSSSSNKYYHYYIPSSLKSVTITLSTSIGSYAFYNCSGLTSITIPNSITSIGSYAFYRCSRLTNITIPDSVTSIGSYAFGSCSSLMSVYITDIEAWCNISFFDNNSLSINPLHNGASLYLNNELVTKLIIPDGVKRIGPCAFYGCSSLTSVEIPDSVTSIGYAAFEGCSNLTSITIPESVRSIDSNAFCGCWSLRGVYITNIKAWYNISFAVSWSGNSYQAYSNPLSLAHNLYLNNELVTELIIPDSRTSIGSYVFCGLTSLTSVVIPNSVTSIGTWAFYGCSGLTSITIPDSVTHIGDYAFYACSSLTNITIPDSVTRIGNSAFRSCSSLTEITLPFVGETKNGTSNTHFGYIFGSGSSSNKNSSVPSSLKKVTITSATNIGSYAFSICSSLTTVVIPDSVTSIDSSAFYNCSNLTELVIPDSVTSIGDEAFRYCSSLTIYCESATKPSGWDSSWNYSNRPVVWGVVTQTYRFDSNGGSGIESKETIVLTNLPTPTKDEWYFGGWYDNADLTGSPVSSPYYSKTKTTLYAKWLTEEEYIAWCAGSSFEKAIQAEVGGSYTVTIDTAGEKVYYKFTATESKSYTIKSSGGLDTYGYLYDSSQSQLTYNDGTTDFTITRSLTAGETYYVVVKFYSSSKTGTFTLTIS